MAEVEEKKIKFENIDRIPVWWFPKMDTLSEEEYQESDDLIDSHLNSTSGVIQFKNIPLNKDEVRSAIKKTWKLGYKAKFIHVWEKDKESPDTITVYYV